MGLLKLTWQGQAHSDLKLRSLDFKAFTRGQVVRISKCGSPRELQTSASEMEWCRHSTSWPANVYTKLLFKKNLRQPVFHKVLKMRICMVIVQLPKINGMGGWVCGKPVASFL